MSVFRCFRCREQATWECICAEVLKMTVVTVVLCLDWACSARGGFADVAMSLNPGVPVSGRFSAGVTPHGFLRRSASSPTEERIRTGKSRRRTDRVNMKTIKELLEAVGAQKSVDQRSRLSKGFDVSSFNCPYGSFC